MEKSNAVFIGYAAGLIAIDQDRTWSAYTPAELIYKLDTAGIDRSRLYLIVADDLSCPDHALSLKDVESFIELLGKNVKRGS